MGRRRGFTLVELLVVIAIIALLMAMLMPALARVRKQAKAVVCMAKLKQWSNIFQIYTGENHGKFYQYLHMGGGGARWWINPCEKYLAPGGLGTCPMANKTVADGARHPYALAWKKKTAAGAWIEGSYCPNGWFMTFPRDRAGWSGQGTYDEHWHTVNIKQAKIAPLFFDAQDHDAWPWSTDPPGPFIGFLQDSENRMSRVTASRHNNGQNIVFADFHTEWVPFKCLWKLKWSRVFDTNVKIPWNKYPYAKGWPSKCD